MPRQARQASGTGIYHVMMRGINHQNIFEEQEDYYQFLNTLGAHRGESAWNGNHRNSLAGEEGFKCPAEPMEQREQNHVLHELCRVALA